MAGEKDQKVIDIDAMTPEVRFFPDGNQNCVICRRLRIVPFVRCRYCDLGGALRCPMLQLGFLLMLLTPAAAVIADLIGRPVGQTVFVTTALTTVLVLLLVNARVSERARTKLRLIHLHQELAEQHEFLRELSPLDSLDGCLSQIVGSASSRLRCRRVSIMLLDEAGEYLHIAAARGVPEDIIERTRTRAGQNTAGRVLYSDKPIHVRKTAGGNGPPPLPIESPVFMCGPLMASSMHWGNVRLGVLSVTEPVDRDDFSIDDEFVFSNICQAAAVAIHNHMTVAKVKQANVEFLETLANAIEARDPYTRGHSERVARYAMAIGRRLSLGDESLAHLRMASHLHDIGKIGMPDAILHKTGPLTPQEWHTVHRHTWTAAEMLSRASLVATALDAIRSHHERLDGSGYPDALSGQNIPLLARIVGVADTFDAVTTARPYHGARSATEAIAELQAVRGVKFDSACVDALIAAVRSGELADVPGGPPVELEAPQPAAAPV